MKKKLIKTFALMLCFVFMLSCTVFAADSPGSGDVPGADSPGSGDVVNPTEAPSEQPTTEAPTSEVPDFGDETTTEAETTTSAADAEAQKPADDYAKGVTAAKAKVVINGEEVEVEVTIKTVINAVVDEAKEQAKEIVGDTASVLKVFDVTLPEGDYSAGVDVTMNIPGVVAGQSITVLHQKADGTWESLPVVKVENDAVTATFTSFSPVAIVVNATAPGTGSETPVVLFGIVALAVVVAGAGIARGAKLKTE